LSGEAAGTLDQAIDLAGLRVLRAAAGGGAGVRIGLVDGTVQGDHPALRGARLDLRLQAAATCAVPSGAGCQHGTFLAGLLAGNGDGGISGLCPAAQVVSLPVYPDNAGNPSAHPDAVADAIHRLLAADVQVINVSAGIARGSLRRFDSVVDACAEAERRGVPVVAASGNQARVGVVSLFEHEWIVPVAACTLGGVVDLRSNLGPTIGRRGLMAPGFAMRGALAPDRIGVMEGSSVAAVFVTATFALLRCLFPGAPGGALRRAVLMLPRRQRSVAPPLLRADHALTLLRSWR
jgi:subtilisin family serine protease